jgi:hypothetical protein
MGGLLPAHFSSKTGPWCRFVLKPLRGEFCGLTRTHEGQERLPTGEECPFRSDAACMGSISQRTPKRSVEGFAGNCAGYDLVVSLRGFSAPSLSCFLRNRYQIVGLGDRPIPTSAPGPHPLTASCPGPSPAYPPPNLSENVRACSPGFRGIPNLPRKGACVLKRTLRHLFRIAGLLQSLAPFSVSSPARPS